MTTKTTFLQQTADGGLPSEAESCPRLSKLSFKKRIDYGSEVY